MDLGSGRTFGYTGRYERKWILFPGAAPSAPVETRAQPGRRKKESVPGRKRRGTQHGPTKIYGEAEIEAHFRFRQNAASRHVSDLSPPRELHSDRLAGNFTLFRVPPEAAAAGMVCNLTLTYHSFSNLSRDFFRRKNSGFCLYRQRRPWYSIPVVNHRILYLMKAVLPAAVNGSNRKTWHPNSYRASCGRVNAAHGIG